MNKLISAALVILVISGIVFITVTMAPGLIPSNGNCYEMLNAAGQVVQTVCN